MVAQRLAAVRRRVDVAAERVGRDPSSVRIVAVSKGRSVGQILDAYDAGHRDFGENRAAELAEKAPQLPNDIVWHFIGSLQSRQAKTAWPHTALLHSLDRPRLIRVWSGPDEAPPVLIQVNVAAEPQKHGVMVGETEGLLRDSVAAGLDCRGLMTIAPLVPNPEDNRRWFVELRHLRDRLRTEYSHLSELSMGMTDDFEVAIEEGATIIRVGRAIFGELGAPAT